MPNWVDYKHQPTFPKKHYFTLFPRVKFLFFSILQTTKLNLKWPTTPQQLWTKWLALNQICGLWQVSREIWTIFLDQKRLQLLGYQTQSVHEKRPKCRKSTGTKLFNGRSWFQPVYSTKKSTTCCSRQLSQRTKFVSSSSIYTIQRHAGAAEACSQGDWRCGLRKQKDLCDTVAIQGGQPRDLLCSNSSIRTEEGGRNLTNCVCHLQTWRICISSWCREFSVW